MKKILLAVALISLTCGLWAQETHDKAYFQKELERVEQEYSMAQDTEKKAELNVKILKDLKKTKENSEKLEKAEKDLNMASVNRGKLGEAKEMLSKIIAMFEKGITNVDDYLAYPADRKSWGDARILKEPIKGDKVHDNSRQWVEIELGVTYFISYDTKNYKLGGQRLLLYVKPETKGFPMSPLKALSKDAFPETKEDITITEGYIQYRPGAFFNGDYTHFKYNGSETFHIYLANILKGETIDKLGEIRKSNEQRKIDKDAVVIVEFLRKMRE